MISWWEKSSSFKPVNLTDENYTRGHELQNACMKKIASNEECNDDE